MKVCYKRMNTNKRLLIAEDNENLRRLLVKMIKKLGFEYVHETENGEEAWEYIRNNPVDLLLTDWEMPEVNGIELIEKIRLSNHPEIKDMSILMITVVDKKEKILEAIKMKINGYIIKPFSMKIVEEKIHQALDE